jgi:hypothetical protein
VRKRWRFNVIGKARCKQYAYQRVPTWTLPTVNEEPNPSSSAPPAHQYAHGSTVPCAALLVNRVRFVQSGHSDAAFTVQIYEHVLGRDHTAAMENVESLLLPQVVAIGTS